VVRPRGRLADGLLLPLVPLPACACSARHFRAPGLAYCASCGLDRPPRINDTAPSARPAARDGLMELHPPPQHVQRLRLPHGEADGLERRRRREGGGGATRGNGNLRNGLASSSTAFRPMNLVAWPIRYLRPPATTLPCQLGPPHFRHQFFFFFSPSQ
jgi:hypothetical protein